MLCLVWIFKVEIFEEICLCKFIIANLWSAYQRVKFLKRLSASEIFETLISEWNFSGSQAFKFTKIKRTSLFFTECEQKCLRNIFISYFFIFQGCSPVPKFGIDSCFVVVMIQQGLLGVCKISRMFLVLQICEALISEWNFSWNAYQRVKIFFETLISEWNFSGSQAFKIHLKWENKNVLLLSVSENVCELLVDVREITLFSFYLTFIPFLKVFPSP